MDKPHSNARTGFSGELDSAVSPPSGSTFLHEYILVLIDATGADFSDNFDTDRFGPEKKPSSGVREFLRRALFRKFGFAPVRHAQDTLRWGLKYAGPHIPSLEWLYHHLADDLSRRWLVQLTAYRALGHRKIKLPTNSPQFWRAKELGLQIPQGDEEIDPDFLGWKLHERSLETLGYPIRMFTGPGACYTTFVHQQYRCETSQGAIECSEGDFAVDAGACYGDTALYLAFKTGRAGSVASFEFLPTNVSVFRRNLALNPDLASRIRLYENPVYSQTGEELFVIDNGPGTRVTQKSTDASALRVSTLKIDDLVGSGDFPRIDFIKMDIEGAELEALKGSEKVLREFKPKLAITVYHAFKDLWTIPQYLDSLGLGYRFYLRHFTIHAEETVLFAQ